MRTADNHNESDGLMEDTMINVSQRRLLQLLIVRKRVPRLKRLTIVAAQQGRGMKKLGSKDQRGTKGGCGGEEGKEHYRELNRRGRRKA